MVRLVVGVHARRGDKLRVWRQQGYIRDILGRYEGRFFRHAMEVRAVNEMFTIFGEVTYKGLVYITY